MTENLHNLEIEQEVLSAMLIRDGEKIPAVLSILSAEDFYFVKNKIIFNGIVNFYLKGFKFDVLSIVDEMKKAGDFEKVGTEYLIECFGATYTNAYIEHHARIIKEKSELRRLMTLAAKMTISAQKGKAPAEIINEATNEFSTFSTDSDISKFSGIKNFFKEEFQEEIEQTKKYAFRKTGFENIDEHQILTAGLYLIGGTPAAGKTTFAWQMAEQLSRSGELCIFCSYEMGRFELFSKSIARKFFMTKPTTKLTAADIRRGGWENGLEKIVEEYQGAEFDLRVLELHNESVDDLLKILRPLCTGKNKAPVIFIDYLQIIPSAKDSVKSGIDDTVRKLKVFQRDTNTTFIVISSFNRANYNQTVSFESFKESGGIEHTADCIWGLQLNILNQLKGGANIYDTRQKIDEAKKNQPRQIQLKCLKNRPGYNYDCYFKYYSAHDYFEPCEESEFEDNFGDHRVLR